MIPTNNWISILKVFKNTSDLPKFNNGHIVSYFVTRSVIDGLPSGDFKSINSSAENLFRCGHVQNIEVNTTDSTLLFLKASCLPEMRKDRIYSLNLALNNKLYDIVYASCSCPAGKGPNGSCKHIGAFCYAFCDFCKCGNIPDFLTCTDKLQSWNKPRGRKVDPIPVDKLCSRRLELGNKGVSPSVVFDPRLKCSKENITLSIEKLRCDLLNSHSTQSCALLTILVPAKTTIQQDHTYALTPSDQPVTLKTADKSIIICDDDFIVEHNPEECLLEYQSKMKSVVDNLCIHEDQRLLLETQTLQQNNYLWHKERRFRITGSKCGKILKQKKRTVALLRFCLYPRPFHHTPKAISWGRKNEPVARSAYIQYVKTLGDPKINVSLCGFYIHRDKGWLGASPDAKVQDAVDSSFGIAEFKCPFSKAEVTVRSACEDQNFYCELTEDQNIKLKRNHEYYHQVQLQLYVSGAVWCDFCVWTTKSMETERIYPCIKWQEEEVPKLDAFFYEFISPEIVNPKSKPSYYL